MVGKIRTFGQKNYHRIEDFMPIISVIVPVYNVEKYLARCLDSILNQTFTDFEVICVNDGSKDKSLAILQKYAQKDARIIVMDQENQGQSVARNKAMKIAQGEYILFVDSDDAIEKQCLEIAYTLITEHHADMVCWNIANSNGQDAPHTTFTIPPAPIKITNNILSLYQRPSYDNYIIKHYIWDKLYKKTLIQSLSFPEGLYYQDAAYSWEVMLLQPKTVITNAKLYIYTLNESSTMQQSITLKHINDYRSITNLIYSMVNTPETKNELEIFKERSIASFLRIQIERITSTSTEKQLPLWLAFEEQVRDLDQKDLLPTYTRKRKKQIYVYRYILQHGATAYYENEIINWHTKPFHTLMTKTMRAYFIFGIKIFSKEKIGVASRAIYVLGVTFKYGKKTS